jgi:threonine dehydrogenase-like Zn-dependent dehydrogenase
MKAALLMAPFQVELVERTLAAPSAGQVRVRVQQCGLCTSEIDLWLGKDPRKLPAAIGHEIAGIVEELGPEVTSLAVGNRVVAWIHEGGFAEALNVEARYCIPVSPHLAYPAVAEPLACVVNAVELASPALADDVVIIGAGYMGNLLQLVSTLKGSRTITVADVRPDALERASQLGATRVVNTESESLSDVVREMTDGRGADLTYEVTGVNPGLDLASDVTRMSGKLCIVGYHQGESRTVDLARWNWMAFTIVNAHFRSIDTIMAGMRTGMRLVNDGILDVAPLMSSVYPLSAIATAFETATEKPQGFVKAVIEPNRNTEGAAE